MLQQLLLLLLLLVVVACSRSVQVCVTLLM
jgi:hypothetical protein